MTLTLLSINIINARKRVEATSVHLKKTIVGKWQVGKLTGGKMDWWENVQVEKWISEKNVQVGKQLGEKTS